MITSIVRIMAVSTRPPARLKNLARIGTPFFANSDARAIFETMERQLLKAIMLPAILASWVFGV